MYVCFYWAHTYGNSYHKILKNQVLLAFVPSASELWPVTDTQAILPIICILNYKNQYANINSTVMVDLTKKGEMPLFYTLA